MGFAIPLEDKPGYYMHPACENIAVIRLGKDFLLVLIEPAESNRWLDVFERISKSVAIKVLVIINCREKLDLNSISIFAARRFVMKPTAHRSIGCATFSIS